MASKADPTARTTTHGIVSGKKGSNDTWVWRGIPFAKPPLGELRWKAPRDPEPWEGVKKTVAFSKMCPQSGGLEGGLDKSSEDCLYLNIWRPRSNERDLPVYFWIHGGGNTEGSGIKFKGGNLSRKANMVVATVNYRLGPLGWFAHPALRNGANALDDSGNYGTLDLIKSLEWVRDNISAFGGDPSSVTIAGESAGGWNVQSLLISPLAAGLFHGAVSQSGPSTNVKPVAYVEKNAGKVVQQLLENDRTTKEQVGNLAEYLRKKT
ncbi:MAG: carboxylesterase family protein, partial [Proteobacteria bacterium]|nr:carboxylesterase family protein [Pseudomonadota bacterium]